MNETRFRRGATRPRGRPLRFVISLTFLITLTGIQGSCDLFTAPDDAGGGRSLPEPTGEIFVLHSLAETLSTVALNADNAVGAVDRDVLLTGAVPNDLVRIGPLLALVASGENALLTVNEDTLRLSRTIDLGTGRNPMRIAALVDATDLPVARWLVAITNLLTDTVSVVDIDGGAVVAEYPVGPSPQTVRALPGTDQSQIRLVVSNTNFRADRPAEIPYGPGSLTELVLEVASDGAGSPVVGLRSSRSIELEEPDHDPATEAGINPGDLVVLPAAGELLVVGSGVNLLPGGAGADDGTVLILDIDTLDILDRISIGGSPARGVLRTDATDTALYTAGVDGIRRLVRHDAAGWDSPPSTDAALFARAGATGSLIADCLIVGERLYAADFAGDRLRVLHADTAAPLQEVALSDGPVALLWDDES